MYWDDVGIAATLLALVLSIIFFALAARSARAQQNLLTETRQTLTDVRELLSRYRTELDLVRETSTLHGLIIRYLQEATIAGEDSSFGALQSAASSAGYLRFELVDELKQLRRLGKVYWERDLQGETVLRLGALKSEASGHGDQSPSVS
ncbi:MAG: hypothetical protein ACREX3_24195 [Gammaproteobacteria bacterium]